MTVETMTKPLSEAQKRRFVRLIEERDVAMKAVQDFILYLQDEHNAPSVEGWVINDISQGFVKTAGKNGSGKTE